MMHGSMTASVYFTLFIHSYWVDKAIIANYHLPIDCRIYGGDVLRPLKFGLIGFNVGCSILLCCVPIFDCIIPLQYYVILNLESSST